MKQTERTKQKQKKHETYLIERAVGRHCAAALNGVAQRHRRPTHDARIEEPIDRTFLMSMLVVDDYDDS
jgi:hypothetical protein